MSPTQQISYAQRYEDLHLLRVFDGQPSGFYIDIGAGHPVYDNVSFAFYLQGWSGITVEPNPWLAQLSEAVRPLDVRVQSLVGAAAGTTTYYLVEDFHGLSTTIEGHARKALSEFGKTSQKMTLPIKTLQALCEQYAPDSIDFLKIDVEGAEREVLLGGDWQRFRPKVVVLEALTPVTMTPAWDDWEPLLTSQGYSFAFFDSLNRYYVAEEHSALAERLAAPASFEGITPFNRFKPAIEDASHPDHNLAKLVAGTDMVRLPLMPADPLVERLINELDPSHPNRPALASDIAAVYMRLFNQPATPAWADALQLAPNATVRDLYRSAVATAPFRIACGRISASYSW